MAEVPLQELLAVATEAAYVAGRRTLGWYNAAAAVESKADNTPVTCADRDAEQTIRQIVQRFFPGHSILGEEHGEIKGNSDYRWIIDPIDGTKSFIHGVPLYGTLIGVEVRGRPSVGAIYLPATDEMIAAADGLGCTWNGRRARVSTVSDLSQATLCVTSVASLMKRSDAYERLAAQVKLNRGWGDCYGYVMVATGRAEIMLDYAINPWDCAPLPPILREAGGVFSTWSGEQTIHGKDGFAATAAIYPKVLEFLRNEKRK